MPSLYEIIDELRREHATPSASRTLDLVVAELGRTQDNLREAIANLDGRAVPTGGREVLAELEAKARAEGVDDLETPVPKEEFQRSLEPVDDSQVGIAALLGGTALVVILLVLLVLAIGFGQIVHSS